MGDNTNYILKLGEEELFKLPCKELKRIARQSNININTNSKKTELVQALVRSSTSALEGVDQNDDKRRITRSRASIFPSLNTLKNQSSSTKHIENYDFKVEEKLQSSKQKTTRKSRQDIKSDDKDRLSSDTLEKFKIVSSIHLKVTQPLSEITNKHGSLKKEENQLPEDVSDNPIKENKSKRSRAKTKPKEDREDLEEESPLIIDQVESDKMDLSSESIASLAEENIETKNNKRGRRKKALERSSDVSENVKVESLFERLVKESRKEQFKSEAKTEKKALRGVAIAQAQDVQSEPTKEDDEVVVKTSRNGRKRKSPVTEKDATKSSNSSRVEDNSTHMSDKADMPCRVAWDIPLGRAATFICDDKDSDKVVTEDSAEPNKFDRPRRSSTFIIGEGDGAKNSRSSSRFEKKNCNHSPRIQVGQQAGHRVNSPRGSITSHTGQRFDTPRRDNTFVLAEEVSDGKKRSSRSSINSNKGNRFDSPRRDNTFLVTDEGSNGRSPRSSITSNKGNRFGSPRRDNTFVVTDEDVPGPYAAAITFANAPGRSTPAPLPSTSGMSIGKRIFTTSLMKKRHQASVEQNKGSTVKKTITKNKTPGSTFKNKIGGIAKKLPDFKSIHQKLFSNMESVGDNQKRQMERAQALIQSPAVPRCAPIRTSSKPNETFTTIKKQVPAAASTTPVVKKLPSTSKAKTPGQPQPVNRFGFKNYVKKAEATTIVGTKLPPVNMEKKKEQGRSLLKGVRMNKRFLLQMQMRQKDNKP